MPVEEGLELNRLEGLSFMEDSILRSIRGLLGPDSDYDVFDPDLIIFINGTFSTLTQLGIGPSNGFRITGEDEKWSDFLGTECLNLDSVKTYIYLKVKMVFDPPANSSMMSNYEQMCKELEWRLNVAVDPGTYNQ